ncbi:MAG: holo-ACP synthase [Planctomycetota bacterium]
MRIIGHGVDLVDKARVERLLAEHGERFLARCFTEGERAYSDGNTRRRMEHLAGRFAAKEAVLKVLGTGWSGGIAWTDAEVVREPSGRPTVVLHGRCAEVAAELGITEWWLSISHIETHAVASAIGVGG